MWSGLAFLVNRPAARSLSCNQPSIGIGPFAARVRDSAGGSFKAVQARHLQNHSLLRSAPGHVIIRMIEICALADQVGVIIARVQAFAQATDTIPETTRT